MNNCKLGHLRPAHLEANDTSLVPPTASTSPRPDPFRFSLPLANHTTFFEDEDEDLLPTTPPDQDDPAEQPAEANAPVRTPVCPAPAPPAPAFHTPHSEPTGARDELTRPLSPAASSPDVHTATSPGSSALPRASSTSRLTRSTANLDDVLEYVYDQLPLERRLAKLFKKKQQPPKK